MSTENETRASKAEPPVRSSGMVLRPRKCQWLTKLNDWDECGAMATHVTTLNQLAYCDRHAEMLRPFRELEAIPQNK